MMSTDSSITEKTIDLDGVYAGWTARLSLSTSGRLCGGTVQNPDGALMGTFTAPATEPLDDVRYVDYSPLKRESIVPQVIKRAVRQHLAS
jgi:hypothetical protein